jgi:hypothetical protein
MLCTNLFLPWSAINLTHKNNDCETGNNGENY